MKGTRPGRIARRFVAVGVNDDGARGAGLGIARRRPDFGRFLRNSRGAGGDASSSSSRMPRGLKGHREGLEDATGCTAPSASCATSRRSPEEATASSGLHSTARQDDAKEGPVAAVADPARGQARGCG